MAAVNTRFFQPHHPTQIALRASIAARTLQLEQVTQELKAELVGIDEVIDRVVESLRAWYVLPQLITRPVIICLWGLTGTGKTQLTRSLAQKLGFYDRFVEVQMDGFSNGSGHRANSISGMLSSSGITEGAPGILVLDEFQRFRTVRKNGEDAKVERYQDVWTLLSDGRLAPTLSFLNDIDYTLADSQYDQERESEDDKASAKHIYKLRPYEARQIKKHLKLKEPLMAIMAWTPEQLQARIQAFQQQTDAWETDYSKLLVFVSGNLDEMYTDIAASVQDCDTDADIFHELSKKLSLIDVKKALRERFKPEQIARLGNVHIIYPSFSRTTYLKLIENTCASYLNNIAGACHLRFQIDPAVHAEIYNNAVFPSQGTRPLFSTIHAVISAPLVSAALWAIALGATEDDCIRVSLCADRRNLVVHLGEQQIAYPVRWELNQLKQRTDKDFRAVIAVHEAGHGLIYGLLFGKPPQELKINPASFEGGYASFAKTTIKSRSYYRDTICVGLAGRAAEAMVFGLDACTSGAQGDLKKATKLAALCIREFGYGDWLSHRDVTKDSNQYVNTDVAPTNVAIEALLQEQYERAAALLEKHQVMFLQITQALVERGEVSPQDFSDLVGFKAFSQQNVVNGYAEKLNAFCR